MAYKPQNLEDVTPQMRVALLRIGAPSTGTAGAKHIRRNDPSNGGIHTNTIRALVRHGYIEPGHDKYRREVWKLSAAGWSLVTAETPRYLTPSARPARTERGYSTDPRHGMRGEPQAVDQATQDRITAQAHQKAKNTGRDVVSEEIATIEQALRRLEEAELGRPVSRAVSSLRSKLRSLHQKAAA